jgi:MarR family transcriptional regulator for hemolysin
MKYNLDKSTSTLVKTASHLFVRLANKYLKKEGIAHAYTPFLMQLWAVDGQIQSSLHKKIGIEQPTAVRTLDRMERDGLIKRIRSEKDRREIKIFLTVKAQKLKDNILTCAKKINAISTRNFSKEEKKALNKLLKKIIMNIEEHL